MISIVLGSFGLLAKDRVLIALNTPWNIMDDAVVYLQIYFIGLPFLFMYNIIAAIFIALGKSDIPLYLLIFSSLLNIGLDLYMVIVLNMGVAGVAIATVIAQGLSSILSFGILMRTMKRYDTQGTLQKYNLSMLKKMVVIALPSMLQQSIVSIGMLLVQSIVNGFGSSVLAGYSAGMRLESLCVVPMIAMGNAMSTFTAQNLGAKQVERINEGYKASFRMVLVFALITFVVLSVFYRPIVYIFLDASISATAYDVGIHYVKFVGYFYLFIGLKSITDGVLRGTVDMRFFTVANLINLAIRVLIAYFFTQTIGIHAAWYGIPIGWFVNYVISYIYYKTGKWSEQVLI